MHHKAGGRHPTRVDSALHHTPTLSYSPPHSRCLCLHTDASQEAHLRPRGTEEGREGFPGWPAGELGDGLRDGLRDSLRVSFEDMASDGVLGVALLGILDMASDGALVLLYFEFRYGFEFWGWPQDMSFGDGLRVMSGPAAKACVCVESSTRHGRRNERPVIMMTYRQRLEAAQSAAR